MLDHDPNVDVRHSVRLLLSDRHAPEARALFLLLARYIHGRVGRRCAGRYYGIMGSAEQEDLVADVLTMLISGALARFEGHTVASLLTFVRTMTDRTVGHAARARIRERDALNGDAATDVEHWSSRELRPDQVLRFVVESPFSDADCAYLTDLFRAGTKAEYARTHGVSRAAVTQRVQRIRARVAHMADQDQALAHSWLEHLAWRSERGELAVSA
ncbi:MAG: hypothetical protein GXP62_01535 [Oligoflexia bacterium]|nr:hypothetical protein [Oligoflexia bacterium]